jgi:hypothetical protein
MASLQKCRYTHDAAIDEILMNPTISQNDLAKMFGFSAGWISVMMTSDAFKERLAERKAEIIDPILRATFEEKTKAAAHRSLDKLIERLDNPGTAVATKDLIAIAKLGIPTGAAAPTVQNNLYVVALPAPAQNSTEWLANRSDPRGALPMVQEIDRG